MDAKRISIALIPDNAELVSFKFRKSLVRMEFRFRFSVLEEFECARIFLPEPSALEAVPERVRRLLAEAKLWCDQERGRRAKLARIIGVSPQAISGWFREAERKHPRKQPTGEQVLALAEFLAKAKDR